MGKQRRYDRLSGVLRIPGRAPGRPGLKRLRYPGYRSGLGPISRQSPASAGSAGRGGAAERMTIRAPRMGMMRELATTKRLRHTGYLPGLSGVVTGSRQLSTLCHLSFLHFFYQFQTVSPDLFHFRSFSTVFNTRAVENRVENVENFLSRPLCITVM